MPLLNSQFLNKARMDFIKCRMVTDIHACVPVRVDMA